jgi:hypothetical protein
MGIVKCDSNIQSAKFASGNKIIQKIIRIFIVSYETYTTFSPED